MEIYTIDIPGQRPGTLGNKTKFQVIISENDDPHGVFGFDVGDLVIHISKCKCCFLLLIVYVPTGGSCIMFIC